MSAGGRRSPRLPGGGRLVGRSVFLSASVPHPDRSQRYRAVVGLGGGGASGARPRAEGDTRAPTDAQVEIEHAVVSLARAVFAEGGRLVFGGHPSLAPLVAMVAGEYLPPEEAEGSRGRNADVPRMSDMPRDPWRSRGNAPVLVHQLEAYSNAIPDATADMVRLGQAQIRWHGVEPHERDVAWDPKSPAYPESLRRMRAEMLRDPSVIAMVCIGGMEGVEEEARMFLEFHRDRPLFVVARTGGAAAVLADEQSARVRLLQERLGTGTSPEIRIIDDEVVGDLRLRLRRDDNEWEDAPLRYLPYPLIMQTIVRDLVERDQ